MKKLNIVLSILFVLFAVVQYNDPDPWNWIIMYLYVAMICGFAIYQKYNQFLLGLGFGVCLFWMVDLFPDFLNWIEMGTPNIASEMKTEEPHIELVREFLGLIICMGAFIFQLLQSRKFIRDKG